MTFFSKKPFFGAPWLLMFLVFLPWEAIAMDRWAVLRAQWHSGIEEQQDLAFRALLITGAFNTSLSLEDRCAAAYIIGGWVKKKEKIKICGSFLKAIQTTETSVAGRLRALEGILAGGTDEQKETARTLLMPMVQDEAMPIENRIKALELTKDEGTPEQRTVACAILERVKASLSKKT